MDSADRRSVRGKYGVTRDSDGSLAVLHTWPWFWRYPVALVGAAVTWSVLVNANVGEGWRFWIVLAIPAAFLMSLTYELTLASIGLGALWGTYHLINMSNGGFASAAQIGVGAFLVAGVYTLLKRSDEARKALAAVTIRLDQAERRLERIHRDIWQVRSSIRGTAADDED